MARPRGSVDHTHSYISRIAGMNLEELVWWTVERTLAFSGGDKVIRRCVCKTRHYGLPSEDYSFWKCVTPILLPDGCIGQSSLRNTRPGRRTYHDKAIRGMCELGGG